MPYKTNAELPDWVKSAFPADIQEAYRKSYNAALVTYKNDEGKAAAVAISTVQKMGYVKKGDKWIKAEYVKDLGLKAGEYLHPNEPDKKLTITGQDLVDYVNNTQKVLDSGGAIPVTISHPKTERDKIQLKEGDIMGVWIDPVEQVPYMAFNPSQLVKGWIKEGKLKAVSPGIYHDVVTSIGKLPSLIDHVALTNSPFNIQQSGFIPVTAEKFGKAVLFFENQYISHEQGGDVHQLLTSIREFLSDRFGFGKSQTSEGGSDMTELEQVKSRVVELEAQGKKDKTEIDARDKTIADLQGKTEKYEAAEKERIATERKAAVEDFTAKVDGLIKAEKVEPKCKGELLKNFGILYDNKVDGDPAVMLLSRFETVEPAKNKLSQSIIVVEKKNIDYSTEEGQAELSKIFTERAKELKAKDPKGCERSVESYHEKAMDEVCEQYDIDKSVL